MNQKVLQRTEISPTIISEIEKAEVEILVVSDWFTDENLFNILLKKQKQGVTVKFIVDGNLKSERIKISKLTKLGGEIYKIGIEDFGMMHQRYCLIDEKIAVFPLAIRSPYFLVNDRESLIVTGHYKTIQNLKTHFYKIKGSANKIGKDKIECSILTRIKNRVLKIFKIKGKETETIKEFDFEKDIKLPNKIKLKMINPASILEDESSDIFLKRN